MAVKPWNFPMYRVGGSYNFAYNSDPYFTNPGQVADFNDACTITIIAAVLLPSGFAFCGHNQNTNGNATAYAPIWTLARYGETDANYGFRCYHNNSGDNIGLQFYMYDGVGAQYTALQVKYSALIAAGINPEYQVLQCAISIDKATNRRLWYINGILFVDQTSAWPFAETGCHRINNYARAAHNAYANWSTTTWSAGGAAGEHMCGPRLVHDDFIDLSNPAVRANIFDDNGDFLWPGHNGAGWLGGTIPWYYSEVGVPWNGNKGTCAATYYRVTSASYARWGHPCGSKWDWPNEPSPAWSFASQLNGVKGLWDLSGYIDEQKYFLFNPFLVDGHLKRMTTSYTVLPHPALRDGAIGSPGHMFAGSNQGWIDYNNVLDAVASDVPELTMTMTLDFSLGANETFGYRKIGGWGSSSSIANFRVTGPWPSESNRHIMITVNPKDSAQFSTGYTVPNNTGLTVWTWQWDNGVFKLWVNGVVRQTVDRSGSGANLVLSTQQFGWFDSTSGNSGDIKCASDFLMIGTTALTDQEIIDLHALLLAGS